MKPVMVTRIEDRNGTVIYEYTPETKDVLSQDVAYAMVDLLKGVTEGGSGTRLRHTSAKKYVGFSLGFMAGRVPESAPATNYHASPESNGWHRDASNPRLGLSDLRFQARG